VRTAADVYRKALLSLLSKVKMVGEGRQMRWRYGEEHYIPIIGASS
jgi:hypothetical protein